MSDKTSEITYETRTDLDYVVLIEHEKQKAKLFFGNLQYPYCTVWIDAIADFCAELGIDPDQFDELSVGSGLRRKDLNRLSAVIHIDNPPPVTIRLKPAERGFYKDFHCFGPVDSAGNPTGEYTTVDSEHAPVSVSKPKQQEINVSTGNTNGMVQAKKPERLWTGSTEGEDRLFEKAVDINVARWLYCLEQVEAVLPDMSSEQKVPVTTTVYIESNRNLHGLKSQYTDSVDLVGDHEVWLWNTAFVNDGEFAKELLELLDDMKYDRKKVLATIKKQGMSSEGLSRNQMGRLDFFRTLLDHLK